VIANLKVSEADDDEENRRTIPKEKALARNTASQLLHQILHAQPGDEAEDEGKIYDAVLFVISDPEIFKYLTKRVICAAYEEQFSPTTEQKARLGEWKKGEEVVCATDTDTVEESVDFALDSADHRILTL
jgi:hypothetical protein